MGKSSFAEQINSVRVMVSGLKSNSDRIAKRGFGNEKVDKLSLLQQTAMLLDNEQEALKSRLKEKTVQVEGTMKEMEALMSEAKKVVKLEMAKESWKEFGINASK
jgi:hypothetical protein